jgi:hypothetical protein
VGEVEAEQDTASVRVVDGRPLARKIGQEHDAVRARRGLSRFGGELDHRRFRLQLARELVAEPVGEGAAGGEPRH